MNDFGQIVQWRRQMSFRSFFNYPTAPEDEQQSELIFLPYWDEANWTILLEYMKTLRFHAGDVVINAGDTDRNFYMITKGRLEVLIPYLRWSKTNASARRRSCNR